jgi:hypothetical protein
MKKLLLLLYVAVAAAGCTKDNRTMIAAKAFMENHPLPGQTSNVLANIAFIKGDATSIVKNNESVSAFFDSSPALSERASLGYREYVEDGEYTILIQLYETDPSSPKEIYSYKKVIVKSGTETPSNVMVFKNSPKGYQLWNNKY